MFGQGSPHLLGVKPKRRARHRRCLFSRPWSWWVWWCALSVGQVAWGTTSDLNLRIVWGGGTARQWTGTVQVRPGSFSNLRHLGLEADQAATLYVAGDAVQIRQRTPRDYDGLDIQVTATRAGTLTLELAPHGHPEETVRVDVPLVDVITGYYHTALDSQNNQLLVQRVPGDSLRVLTERESLVMVPGERWDFRIAPHLMGMEAGTALRCHVQLVSARTDRQWWETSVEFTAPSEANWSDPSTNALAPISLTIPDGEGVYELVASVYPRKMLRHTFVRAKPLLQRRVQLVVIASQPRSVEPRGWELVDVVDPHQVSWMEWLTRVPKLPLLPDFRQEPLGNRRASNHQRLGGNTVQLSVGGWQAYPLPVREVGKPHLLEIEYPGHVAQTLGISVLEPNAVGKIVPLGLDSGVLVTEESSSDEPGILRHRLIFWPRTNTPLVLVTNRSDTSTAEFGRIRVLAGPEVLPAAPGSSSGGAPSSRLLAAYFDQPLFPENFGASESADEWSGRSLKDWVTFHQGATRLVEYLKHVGYNGAIISVAHLGSTIYPSRQLASTPMYDTGTYFGSGQDPVRKDVLEMLFRLFDREGLTLIPAVEFSCALGELEELLRRPGQDQTGILLTESEQRAWRDVHGGDRGRAPHYNPLDPRVQEAMRRVLAELTDRYAAHGSFGGLALQMSPWTYALFPGEAWGKDAATWSRFERETGATQPTPTDAQAADPRIRDRQRAWLTWRAEQLAKFHQQLAADVTARKPEGRLFLLGGEMFTGAELQPMLRPTLPNQLRLHEALLHLGLDVNRSADAPTIIVPRPERIAPRRPLIQQAVNVNLATNPVVEHTFARGEPAAGLFVHETHALPLPSFDATSPFGKENTRTVLFTQFTPSAAANRQRFVRQLAVRDMQHLFDGGAMLVMGQEESVRDLFATFRELPLKPFDTVEPQASAMPTQPLVVRTHTSDGRTYLYVVNDSPWSVAAEVDLGVPGPVQLRGLGGRSVAQPRQLAAQWTWEVDLEPYDLVGVVAEGELSVETWRVSIDRHTYARLRQRVTDFHARVMMLDNPPVLDVLSNPSFEAAPDRLPGWLPAQDPEITISPDARHSTDGKQSLRMFSQGKVAWIRSDPFPPPKSGRIAVIVRLKTADPEQQPPLRLAIEGQLRGGGTYYKPFHVGQGPRVQPLPADWGTKPFVLLISDLPVRDLLNVRVGFDLMGAGEVWIDDVRVYDHWLPKNERDELMIMRGLAARAMSTGQLAECQRILSGYWPQFLAEHVTVEEPRMAALVEDFSAESRAFPPPQPKSDDDNSSVMDKFKRRFPTKVLPFKLR